MCSSDLGSLGLNPAELNGTLMAFETSDWGGQGDATAVLSTRGGAPRGTRGGSPPSPLLGLGWMSAVASPLTSAPGTPDGNCATTGGEYAGAGSFSNANLTGWVGTSGGYVYLCFEVTGDSDSDVSDDATIYFDTNYGNESAPQTEDRKFRVVSGTTSIEQWKGTGSGWQSCTSPDCDSGNAAAGAFRSDREVYEFKIAIVNAWGEVSPPPGDPAGFAIIAYDASSATYLKWGSWNPVDGTPSSWGRLEIPEFRDLVVPIAGVLILGLLWRRRRAVAPTRSSP